MFCGKDGRKPKIWVPLAVFVLALAAGGAAFVLGGDFFMRTFSSPEKYFQHVMKKNLQKKAEMSANLYNGFIKEQMNFTDRTVGGTITLRLGDRARDLLELAGDMEDLSWLEQVSLDSEFSAKERVFSGNAALRLGEDSVLTENFAADERAAYLQVPELSDKYVGVGLETFLEKNYGYLGIGADEIFDYLDSLYTSFPEKKQVEALLYKYSCLAVSGIGEVERSREALSAGGVTEKCTVLETVIRTDTAKTMLKSVLEEMRADEELKGIIEKLSEMERLDGIYDEFRDAVDMALDEVDNLELSGNPVLTVYVNGKGDVIGVRTEEGDSKYYSIVARKGKKIGYESICGIGSGFLDLKGQGELSGGVVNMDFELKIYGPYYRDKSAAFRLENLDLLAAMRGNFKGTVTIPLKEIDELLELDNRMLRRYDMALSFDIEDGSMGAELRLLEVTEEVAAVSCSFRQGAGKQGSIPPGRDVIMAEDGTGLLEWAESVDADRFIDGLKKTKLPEEIIYEIKDAVDNALESLQWLRAAGVPMAMPF